MIIDSNGIKTFERSDAKHYKNYNHPEAGLIEELINEPTSKQCTWSSFLYGGNKVIIPQWTPQEKFKNNINHIDFGITVIDKDGVATPMLIDNKRVSYDTEKKPVLNLSNSVYNTSNDIFFLINNEFAYDTSKGPNIFDKARLNMYSLKKIVEADIAKPKKSKRKDAEDYMQLQIIDLLHNVDVYHSVFYGYRGSKWYEQPIEQFGYRHTTNEMCLVNRCIFKKYEYLYKLDTTRPATEKLESTLHIANELHRVIEEICRNYNINKESCDSILRMCGLKI